MKIVFAIKSINSNIGGAEKVFCKITSLLVQKGYEIIILTFDKPGETSFYKIDPRIRRISMNVGSSSKRTNFIEFIQRIKKLKSFFKLENPDIAVGFMSSIFIILGFSLIGTNVPCIASEHITINYYRKRPIEFFLLLLSSFFIDRYTVLSLSIKKNYPNFISNKMNIITNPISKPNIKRQKQLIKRTKVILNIGRLVPQKDHKTLIEAFSIIDKFFPEWELHIYGEGYLKKQIQSQIFSLGLSDRIFLKGTKKDMQPIYLGADVCVNSSRFESFGLVTAEAMSYSLPCIGFDDCPGTNELIRDGETGLLVKNNGQRSSSLASGLMLLLSDNLLRKKLGKAGNSLISSKYSDKKVLSLWEKLFHDILENKS